MDRSVLRIGLSFDVNDSMKCPGIMASFSQPIRFRCGIDFYNWRMIDLRICRKIYNRKKTQYTPGTSGIYLSLIAFCKKTDIYNSFFRIKSLRACWIVLQRWAWGRQRGVAFSLFLVPFSYPISASSWTNCLKILEKDFKKREKKKIDYSATQSIQKSARFSFRVVWFVHAPVTHPTFQPLLTVSIVFLFISLFSFLFFSPTFVAFSVATRPLRRNAHIIFPCAHAIFLFFFCKFIS